MGDYGKVAIKATALVAARDVDSPKAGWVRAAQEIFPGKIPSQEKACPQCAYLGLCEDGLVSGVTPGRYTKSKDNKRYAVNAVKILIRSESRIESHSDKDAQELWEEVAPGKTHNQQMDVVLSLWRNNLIVGRP
jgi:hypothetical protein